MIKTIKQDEDNTLNRKEKLLSLFASEISVLFDEYCAKKAPEENPEYVGERLNIFDARIFEVTQEQGLTYFCLRQAFGIEHIITRIVNKKHIKELDVTTTIEFLKSYDEIKSFKHNHNPTNIYELLFGNAFNPQKHIYPFEFNTKKQFLKSIAFKK